MAKFLVAVWQWKFYVQRLIAESMYLKFLYRNSWLKYAFDDFVAEIPCRRPVLCNFVDEIPCCKLQIGISATKLLVAACRKRFCCRNSYLQLAESDFVAEIPVCRSDSMNFVAEISPCIAAASNFVDEITRRKEKSYRNSGRISIRYSAAIQNKENQ